jgi:rhodanese-related sulfurtransferase
MGFEQAANLEGGFDAWKEAGLPISEHHSGI